MSLPDSQSNSGQDPYASIKSAFEILAAGAPAVAKSLVDIATNGKSEMARMYAAQAVFDRIGMPARVDVGITSSHLAGVVVDENTGGAVDTIVSRLAMLRQQAEKDHMVIEGNVIEFPDVMQLAEAAVPATDGVTDAD